MKRLPAEWTGLLFILFERRLLRSRRSQIVREGQVVVGRFKTIIVGKAPLPHTPLPLRLLATDGERINLLNKGFPVRKISKPTQLTAAIGGVCQ